MAGRARADKYNDLRLRPFCTFDGALGATADFCHAAKRSLRSDQAIRDNLVLAVRPSGITLSARSAIFRLITLMSALERRPMSLRRRNFRT